MYLTSTQQLIDRMEESNRIRGYVQADILDATKRELRILNEMLRDYLPEGHASRGVDPNEVYAEYATHVDEQIEAEEEAANAAMGAPLPTQFQMAALQLANAKMDELVESMPAEPAAAAE